MIKKTFLKAGPDLLTNRNKLLETSSDHIRQIALGFGNGHDAGMPDQTPSLTNPPRHRRFQKAHAKATALIPLRQLNSHIKNETASCELNRKEYRKANGNGGRV